MLYEGGIREPLVIKWPGVTEAGSTCREPVIGVDFYPTLMEAANVKRRKATPLDGRSLMPLLKDASASLGRPALFWHFPAYLQGYTPRHGAFRTTPAAAVRMGDWKLIEYFEDGALELYNLKNDLGEKTNLAELESGKVKELHAAMLKWRKETKAPVPTEKIRATIPRRCFRRPNGIRVAQRARMRDHSGFMKGFSFSSLGRLMLAIFLVGLLLSAPRTSRMYCSYSPMINVMKPSAHLVTRYRYAESRSAGQARNDFTRAYNMGSWSGACVWLVGTC